MLFARWHHHIRFASSFAYAPFNAMVTKISKWSRIQDSCRITPKIESLVAYAMPDIPSKFQKNPSITFWVILLTHRQTDKQTKTGKNITSLEEVTMIRHHESRHICWQWGQCVQAKLLAKRPTSKVILQQDPSIGKTLNQVHFSSGKVCKKVAKYDAYLFCITMSVYELFECPSKNRDWYGNIVNWLH